MNDRQSCQSECDAYTIAETKGKRYICKQRNVVHEVAEASHVCISGCYQEQFCAQQPKCNGR